jgi:hypothetical protein
VLQQAPLMQSLPTVLAVMEAHPGALEVTSGGFRFLESLTEAGGDPVRKRLEHELGPACSLLRVWRHQYCAPCTKRHVWWRV